MNDFDFISQSAAQDGDKSPVVAQLVSVNLEADEMREYRNSYHPSAASAFGIAVDELSQIAGRLSWYMAFLRFVISNARRLSVMDEERQREVLIAEAERIMKNVLTVESIKNATTSYMENMQLGSPFVIAKVADGYDINFIGSSVSTPRTLSIPYHENAIINVSTSKFSESYTYKAEKLEAYSTELSIGAVRAGRHVLEHLFGSSVTEASSASTRKLATVPMDFDFEQFNNVFFDKTGIALGINFFKNVPHNILRRFGKMMRISFVRSPNPDFVRVAEAHGPGYDMSEHITEEGLALSQNISLATTLHLPEKLARFICQVDESQKLPLSALATWATMWNKRYGRPPSSKIKGGNVKRREMPLFVVPLSKVKKTTDIRRLNNYAVEAGKGDEHNIYIGADGGLHYGLPTSLRSSVEQNLDDYEKTMEEFFEHCYSSGLPADQHSISATDAFIVGQNRDFVDDLNNKQAKVRSFTGKALTFDWDYAISVTVSVDDPTLSVTKRTIGSAKVNDLTLADYLGYNFAEPGEKPIQKTFADSLVLMLNMVVSDGQTTGSVVDVSRFARGNEPTAQLTQFYMTCADAGIVPPVQELIDRAKSALSLTTLEEAPYVQGRLYRSVLDNDMKLTVSATVNSLSQLFELTLQFCSASVPLLRDYIAKKLDTNDQDTIEEEMKESEVYFDARTSRMRDLGNTYNLLGGKVFQLACEEITNIPHDKLFSGPQADKFSYDKITTMLMPQAVMFARYVPAAETIFEKAELEVERNQADPSITAEDIKVPGSTANMQFFPHQISTHGALRKRPAFAILDIRPGGGKTMLGLSDIAALVLELTELGETVKPVIICPENLIVNWVNDDQTLTGTNWNVIPITGAIVNRWGYAKLEELIVNAPKNTICVMGMNFLKAQSETIVLGNVQVKVSNNLEFAKRLGFDYILIDESQKLARKNSQRHRSIKQLTTASHVKYLRLASGTFIHGRVSDAIGQTSLYNGHIFREGDDLTGKESDISVGVNGEDIPIWKVDTPARARKKLSQYASITTLQKKHWAFMLPSPIESFFAVPLVAPDGANISEEERSLEELHRQLYDTVLNESLEKLEDLAKTAKATRKSKSDDDEDDDDDDDDIGENDDMENEDNQDLDMGDDEGDGLSAAQLRPYLQRLERLITNPMADPLAPSVFGLAGVTQYHSSVARFVAERISKHYEIPAWDKDKLYPEYTLVSHQGKQWLSKKLSSDNARVELPAASKGVEPHTSSEYWREEPKGKVIVFCQYVNSVEGVYQALPEKYKSVAVRYSGAVDNKLANLDAFKNDDRVQILIANEMGISEGHNLQFASRIIRVESPWSPGDLDQSASRIFRPDPLASKAMRETGRKGELYREVVFLDWIVCDGTLQVQKQARLIAKVFNKARFDEVGNPNYENVLNDYELDEVPMSLESFRSRSTLQEFDMYRRAYAALNGAQQREFNDMRRTQDPSMQDLPQTPALVGSARIRTPFISNQRIQDDRNIGLVSLRNLFRDPTLLSDLEALKGLPVVTDVGDGRIARYRPRYKYNIRLDETGKPVIGSNGKVVKDPVLDANGKQVIDEVEPVSSITVKLASGEMVSISDPGLAFIATKLTKAAEKDFAVRNLHLTEAQERKQEEREAKEAERDEKRTLEEQKRLRKQQREAADRKAAAEDGKKRKENIKRGKPINAGIKRVKDVPSMPTGIKRVKDVPAIGPEEERVTIHPAYYHGYLTLDIQGDDLDEKLMKKLKFRKVPSYVYARASRFAQFDKIVTYLESNFVLSKASQNRLLEIEDAFEVGGKEIYKMELVSNSTLPLFFATSQKIVTNRKEVKPYPIIMPNELQLAIDIAACPAIAKHIGKAIPGASTKWVQHEGHYMYFAQNKNDMKAKMKELEASGLIVENKQDALSEITNIKFRAPRASK